MDPRIVKGVIVLLAIVAQVLSDVPLNADTILALLSAFAAGAATIKRPGDVTLTGDLGDT